MILSRYLVVLIEPEHLWQTVVMRSLASQGLVDLLSLSLSWQTRRLLGLTRLVVIQSPIGDRSTKIRQPPSLVGIDIDIDRQIDR